MGNPLNLNQLPSVPTNETLSNYTFVVTKSSTNADSGDRIVTFDRLKSDIVNNANVGGGGNSTQLKEVVLGLVFLSGKEELRPSSKEGAGNAIVVPNDMAGYQLVSVTGSPIFPDPANESHTGINIPVLVRRWNGNNYSISPVATLRHVMNSGKDNKIIPNTFPILNGSEVFYFDNAQFGAIQSSDIYPNGYAISMLFRKSQSTTV